jgi:hypothetical protein
MKLPRRTFLRLAAGGAALPVVWQIARAQSYPSRPVRVIVATAAGGGNDIAARLIGQWLSEHFGQPFVVENRPGAGSNIGTEAVVRATADGYTLLLVSASNAMNATLYEKLTFNFIQDIAPVAGITRTPLVVLVNPSVPAMMALEFIAYAKANPGKINFASGGNGTPSHMSGELFKDDGRCRPGSRALSRFGARAHRPSRRTGAAHVWRHHRVNSVHSIRQAARTRSDHYDAVRTVVGPADLGRLRAWLRGEPMVSARPRTRPQRSSIGSTRKSTRVSVTPKSKYGSPVWGEPCSPARPPISAN